MARSPRIAIIGGGIGGLAAALALDGAAPRLWCANSRAR